MHIQSSVRSSMVKFEMPGVCLVWSTVGIWVDSRELDYFQRAL